MYLYKYIIVERIKMLLINTEIKRIKNRVN